MREAGELDFDKLDKIHSKLMRESAMYREAYALKLIGLLSTLQLRELNATTESP